MEGLRTCAVCGAAVEQVNLERHRTWHYHLEVRVKRLQEIALTGRTHRDPP
ncbi:hypothetical protein [Nocardioides sp. URHA0020]|uniref:hypothetical protein n=1 Tax=Nocardioides sp. URHA0020 TaxID=1380392 RepID=UPI0012DFA047|nr:hypothetical protein [Nocardioides sp. URHA0020]